MNILQYTNPSDINDGIYIDYGLMVNSLNKTISYLKTRYDVRLHYDHFRHPKQYAGDLLYKVRNKSRDIMWVYYINNDQHYYISVETEPEYLETGNPDISVFDRSQIRKSHPCQKLFFHDYDQIKDSLIAICDSIDEYFNHGETMNSYQKTEWLVPCNPAKFDIENAQLNMKEMYWRQNASYSVGDIMYIYVSGGTGEVRFKYEVEELNIHLPETSESYWLDHVERAKNPLRVKVKLLKRYPDGAITLDELRAHGLKSTIQGPFRPTGTLLQYLHDQDDYFRVISFPCGSSIDYINATYVHAHPFRKGYPSESTKWMMARATGGISNTIYEVIKTQVYDVSSYPENCSPEIRAYIEMRQGGMGFKEDLYRFYILKPTYTFSKPYVLVPNIQGYKYYSLNELIPYKDVVKLTKGFTVTHNINQPLPPDSAWQEDTIEKVSCANCGFAFIKAPRCPRCGQLQKY